jgi:menaquinone-dependent protoporphyrinogen IX oxidase
MKCFVGYVTKTGTTMEIAQRVGEALAARGIEADVAAITVDRDLRAYDRLVFGCPINGMKVLPDFATYLGGYAAKAGRPVDLFIVSYMFENGRSMWKKAIRGEAERVKALAGARTAEIFAGRIAGSLPGFARFIFGVPKDLPADIRDWEKIERWANGLADSMLA